MAAMLEYKGLCKIALVSARLLYLDASQENNISKHAVGRPMYCIHKKK